MPREPENWDATAVWKDLRYRTTEQWLDRDGRPFLPYTHYCVGGNTKFWGSVLYRLRKEDFEAVEHLDGVSPAWPIDYATLEPLLRAGRATLPGARRSGGRPHGAAARAVSSAALLLRSAGDRHPHGLGNSSGLVGRRYMAHLATMMQGFYPLRINHAVFQKTVLRRDGQPRVDGGGRDMDGNLIELMDLGYIWASFSTYATWHMRAVAARAGPGCCRRR